MIIWNGMVSRSATTMSKRNGRFRFIKPSMPPKLAVLKCLPPGGHSLPESLKRLAAKGIQIAPLILHTGVSNIETHEPPYKEFYRVTS